MDESERITKISELKKKILILEWDKKRNQINFGKNVQLEEYKKELEEIGKGLENDKKIS